MVIKPIATTHKVKICCDKTNFCFLTKFSANLTKWQVQISFLTNEASFECIWTRLFWWFQPQCHRFRRRFWMKCFNPLDFTLEVQRQQWKSFDNKVTNCRESEQHLGEKIVHLVVLRSKFKTAHYFALPLKIGKIFEINRSSRIRFSRSAPLFL